MCLARRVGMAGRAEANSGSGSKPQRSVPFAALDTHAVRCCAWTIEPEQTINGREAAYHHHILLVLLLLIRLLLFIFLFFLLLFLFFFFLV